MQLGAGSNFPDQMFDLKSDRFRVKDTTAQEILDEKFVIT
jgi:hypothetical protein